MGLSLTSGVQIQSSKRSQSPWRKWIGSSSRRRKQPLQLDWPTLLEDSDYPWLLLVVTSGAGGGDPGGSPTATTDSDQSGFMDVENMSDSKLCELIPRFQRTMRETSRNLPDKGKKIRAIIKRLEAEKKRRTLRRVDQVDNECVNSTLSTSLAVADALDVREEIMTDVDILPSSTRLLSSCLDNADCRIVEECGEVSALSDQQGNGYDKNVCARGKRCASSSKHRSFQSPRNGSLLSLDKNKQLLDGDQMGGASSTYMSILRDHRYDTRRAKKKDGHDDSKTKEQTVVLDDEEDGQVTDATEQQGNEVAECLQDATLYYPSRDDPGSVEISYKDIDCLAPEGYLTSPIMNFYIKYIQRQAYSSDRGKCEYHFFNTFFYNKLQEAVPYKRNQKDGYFTKFRRWWKGVNIFEKAYLLIPINEDLHWSLAIISIPDKHDQSGPIILHLDSLQLHRCKPIFANIKRFLVEEWKYLNQEKGSSNPPIADRVWERLPRIGEKKITVPQQKNEFDCGLFVLYFMQRLIEEATERLMKKDLATFGKKWFKPEEASSLRTKIRKLLVDEFQSARDSASSSVDNTPPKDED